MHTEAIRLKLAIAPKTASSLMKELGISQPMLSRALQKMGAEVVRLGAARSIHYVLRDTRRGVPPFVVYRVDAQGQIAPIATLEPVMPEGFVAVRADGALQHSDGLPWWLMDMRPQGYLGRAWAARHAQGMGLPEHISHWSDTHALRALLAQGSHCSDVVGDLLLGDAARQAFLAAPAPQPIAHADKPAAYTQRAREAASGEAPGSSAGGEQPKFAAYVQAGEEANGGEAAHVLVKFSECEEGPVAQRWRDILLAEHHALQTLADAGVAAARSRIVDVQAVPSASGAAVPQRFLEVERFDRVGALGRKGVLSLSALDAEFVGQIERGWPQVTAALAQQKIITKEAAQQAALLWAFGTLTGNTDMHGGNLSFMVGDGPPYALAPAYDMAPMGFAPRSGGGLPERLAPVQTYAAVDDATWHQALLLAQDCVRRLQAEPRWSARFAPCVQALAAHVETAAQQIARLA